MRSHLSAPRTTPRVPLFDRLAAFAALATLVPGCARAADVTTAYPAARGDLGAIEVVLNDPSRAVSVTVDGALVVDRARTRKVHVDAVPAGPAHVQVATGGRCEHAGVTEHDVTVTPGATTTIALPGPSPELGCMVFDGLYLIGEETGLVAIAILVAASRHGR